MFWKMRYLDVSWIGKAAKRRKEGGGVEPRMKVCVVSWRRVREKGLAVIGEGILA